MTGNAASRAARHQTITAIASQRLVHQAGARERRSPSRQKNRHGEDESQIAATDTNHSPIIVQFCRYCGHKCAKKIVKAAIL